MKKNTYKFESVYMHTYTVHTCTNYSNMHEGSHKHYNKQLFSM